MTTRKTHTPFKVPTLRLPTLAIMSGLASIGGLAAADPVVPAKAIPLFNGTNLDGFHTWLVDSQRADPRRVFTVADGMIHISGDGLGYLSTEQEFADYHLVAGFKWGARNRAWGDRVGKARDSGIFLHSAGPDGNSHDGKGAFKAAIECNLFQGATGDFLLIRGTDSDGSLLAPRLTATVTGERDADGWYTWKHGGMAQTIERWGRINWSGKSREWKDMLDFRSPGDVENPPGEWNRVDCVCDGGRITVKVNGKVVNEAFDVSPRQGKILLQCEGSEVFFRKLELQPLEKKREPDKLAVSRETDAVVIRKASGETVLRYQLTPPPDAKLSVPSGCYFHPLTTPEGIAVTDVAPDDHRHHRGIFLAFVEMRGRKDADFWGWGEHAPVKGRQIVNTKITDLPAGGDAAGFLARNEWRADGDAIVVEELKASTRMIPAAQVLDLDYTLTADADLKLSQWAFSGFCVRLRRDGSIEAHGPSGPVKLPDPIHTKPDSDWPAAAWYAFTLTLENGERAGVAVIDHAKNPPSLWHNHSVTRMLNPCIVAPSAVTLKATQPLRLRYRVVAFDGDLPKALLNGLVSDWEK